MALAASFHVQKSRLCLAGLACLLLGLWVQADCATSSDTGSITDRSLQELAVVPTPSHEPKGRVRSSVITPYRSATVPSEVPGTVEAFNFEEGAKVESGQVVVEISSKRYAALVEALDKKLISTDLTLNMAQQKLEAKRVLLARDWSTKQRVIEAEEEVAIAGANRGAVAKDLEVARLDLAGCTVRAPFSGYLTNRYVEPFEAVERLGRLFSIVDTTKVYAIGHVSENFLKLYEMGSKSIFTHVSGLRFSGVVDRVSPVITPESRTAKIWVLIDNPKDELRVGMTGSLEPE
jgi:RND family efflux transporter MFP subunit